MAPRNYSRRGFLTLASLAAAGTALGQNAPLNLSIVSTIEKNKLHSGDAFVPLVKIVWPNGTVLRLARNTDDVTFDCGDGQGVQTYTAFAWDFAELQEASDGSVPTWSVKVSNVGRAVESMLETVSGGVGAQLTVFVIQLSQRKPEPALELDFDITGSVIDSRWCTLTLGAQSPLRINFTRHPYSADVCRWRYKSPQCGYTGPMPTCSYRLGGDQGCRAHGNQQRYGAYPGIDSNGLREVTK